MLTDFWFLAYIFLSSKSAFRFSWGSTFPAFFDGAKIWRHFETAISSMWTNTRTTTIDYQYFSKFPYGQRTKTHPYSHVRTALFYPNLCRQAVCTPETLLLYKLPFFTCFVHQRGFSCTECRHRIAGRQSVHKIHFSCTNCRISPASYTREAFPVRTACWRNRNIGVVVLTV